MIWIPHSRTSHGTILKGEGNKRKLLTHPRPVHVRDPDDGLYKSWIERGDEIRGTFGRVKQAPDTGLLFGTSKGAAIHKTVRIQKEIGPGNWQFVTLDPDALVRSISDEDQAQRIWRYKGQGILDLMLDVGIYSKWTYQYKAQVAGIYRAVIEVSPRFTSTMVSLTRRKSDDRVINCWWHGVGFHSHYGWRDMIDDIVDHELDGTTLRLLSRSFTLAVGESMVLDPTTNPEAGWSADCRSSNAAFPEDGEDYCAGAFSTNWRCAYEFSLSGLPTTATVDVVTLRMNVKAISSPGSLIFNIGPYNGDGTGDPSADTSTGTGTIWGRCDTIGRGDEYITGITSYRTTGEHPETFDVGSYIADIEALAGGQFNLCIQEDSGTTFTNNVQFYEAFEQVDPEIPELQITYTSPGLAPVMEQVGRRRRSAVPRFDRLTHDRFPHHRGRR